MPEITTLEELTKTPHAEVFERQEPRTVRLQLDADEQIPGHTHPGADIVLYLVSGQLELWLDDDCYEMKPDQVAQFSGEREIAPRAVEPSTAVVVFSPTVDADE